MEKQEQQTDSSLCINNCGFFGSPSYNNMCSKCFRDTQQKNTENNTLTKSSSTASSLATSPVALLNDAISVVKVDSAATPLSTSVSATFDVLPAISAAIKQESAATVIESSPASSRPETAASSSPNGSGNSDEKQKNKSRCFKCNTKVTISKQITNKCKCELIFCDEHRAADKHDCQFDHQTVGKSLLAKNNPKVLENKGGRSFNKID